MNTNEILIPEIQISLVGENVQKQKVASSHDAYKLLAQLFPDSTIELREEFRVLYLDQANQVLGSLLLSIGSSIGTVVDIKHTIAVAIKVSAMGLILCHNHPSGTLSPSDADKKLTLKMKLASEYFDIKLLDHLVISKSGYFSFADEGLI